VWGDYKPLPSPWRQNVIVDRTMYGRNLIDEPHRSHASRYGVLIDDVRNDITRFEPFYTAAARVLELDRKRSASLKLVSAAHGKAFVKVGSETKEETLPAIFALP
jgi:hypothetical protein